MRFFEPPAVPVRVVRVVIVATALAVTGGGGGCLRFSAQAQPNGKPIAKVAETSIAAHGGDVVVVDGSGSIDPDGDDLSFRWSSDDVAVSDADQAKASVTAPAAAGHYVVSLVVSDGVDDSAAVDVDIHVNAPPVAAIDAPASTPNQSAVTLHGSADDEPGTTFGFAWRVVSAPAGSQCNATSCLDVADQADVRLTPDVKGDFVIELVVDDGDLASAPVRATVASANRAPIAVAVATRVGDPDAPVRATDEVELTSTGSADPDGDALTFTWSIAQKPTGATATLTTPGAPSTRFTANKPGEYRIDVHAADDDGGDGVATAVITVVDTAPEFTSLPDEVSTQAGQSVSLTAAATDRDGDVVSFHWTLLHAPGGAAATLVNADSATLTFTPAARSPPVTPGSCSDNPASCYTLQVSASDGVETDVAQVFVVATNRAPVITSVTTSPLAAVAQQAAQLAAVVADADGDNLVFSWTVSQTNAPAGAVCVASPSACLTGADTSTPALTVPVAGAYVVALSVRDADGAGVFLGGAATANVVVNASAPPPPPNRPPQLTAPSPVSAQAGVATAVSASTVDPDGDVVAFAWRVTAAPAGGEACTAGAGTSCLSGATTPVPLFTAPVAGQFVLEVRADDGNGHVVTASVVVNAAAGANHAPTVSAPSPVDAVALTAVALSATASDADGDTVAFSWRVTASPASAGNSCTTGAGTVCIAGADTATPLFTAPVAGAFVLEVTVTDLDAGGAPRGGAAQASVVVNAAAPPNQPPVAVIAADATTITSGDTINLDGADSVDLDGSVTAFAWDVVNGPAGGISLFAPAAADVVNPSLTLRGRGQWTVELVVTDDDGADSTPATLRIGVNNAPPVITSVTADGVDATNGVARANGTAIAFAAAASDLDPQDTSPTFSWSIVDRTAAGGGAFVNATTSSPTFTPTQKTAVTNPALCTPGACYKLRLVVSDGIASVQRDVVVTSANRAPVANAGPDQPNASEIVALDGTASSDPDGDALVANSFRWTQTLGADVTGGAGFLTGAITSFTAPGAGVFAFTLTVSDGALTSAGDAVTITVNNVDQPPVVTIANPDVNGTSLLAFPLHVDVTDPDLDNTSVTWTRTSGPSAFFPATLSGADPAFTAPSLRALLAATDGDNRASYSVIATDPDGKSSTPITVNLFVLPGAEHFVVNPASGAADDAAACGTVAHPCRTLVATLPKASAQARDLVLVSGAFAESVSGGATLLLQRTLWGAREATHFTKTSTASSVTCALASGSASSDVTCLTVDAGSERVDGVDVSVGASVAGAQVGLACDACTASFTRVGVTAGIASTTEAGGATSVVGVDVAGPATGTASPTFASLRVTARGSCAPVGVRVGAGVDAVLTGAVVDVDQPTLDCATTTATALAVTGGALTVTRGDIALTSDVDLVTADISGGAAAVLVGGNGVVDLEDTRLVTSSGDGLALVDGDAILARTTIASTSAGAAVGAGLRVPSATASAAALVELTAVTGFAQSFALDDGGAGFSFSSSSLADAAAGTSTCGAVPFDPALCDAADADSAFAVSCAFTGDFHLVDAGTNQCIDAADAAGITSTDLDGDARPDLASGRLDIGFDELP